MAGILEQFSKGLFGLAPVPQPNSTLASLLDSGAEWGRGVQNRFSTLASPQVWGAALSSPPEKLGLLSTLLNPDVPQYKKRQVVNNGIDMVLNAGGLMGLGQTVFHGSPHLFNKFDMSKIGTGEGAQAYGHGLYFAENPNVAINYRDQLSTRNMPKTTLGDSQFNQWLDYAVNGADDSAHAMKMIDELAASSKTNSPIPKGFSSWEDFSKKLKDAAKTKFGGNLYKVDLPDEHIAKMLDWDKPLSQQSEHVKNALKTAVEKYPNMTGEQLYRKFAIGDTSRPHATQTLKEMGIPGIRYLDGGSRAGGQGTSNFVVFSDEIPKIIGRE